MEKLTNNKNHLHFYQTVGSTQKAFKKEILDNLNVINSKNNKLNKRNQSSIKTSDHLYHKIRKYIQENLLKNMNNNIR
jgi:hypothetical protein